MVLSGDSFYNVVIIPFKNWNFSRKSLKVVSMAGRGEMFQEFDEKRRVEGFFTKLHKSVCEGMGEENLDKLVGTHFEFILNFE